MEQTNGEEAITLDSYMKGVKNQEIKGILLKLKNEIRRSKVDKDLVESILNSLKDKDPDIAGEVLELIGD